MTFQSRRKTSRCCPTKGIVLFSLRPCEWQNINICFSISLWAPLFASSVRRQLCSSPLFTLGVGVAGHVLRLSLPCIGSVGRKGWLILPNMRRLIVPLDCRSSTAFFFLYCGAVYFLFFYGSALLKSQAWPQHTSAKSNGWLAVKLNLKTLSGKWSSNRAGQKSHLAQIPLSRFKISDSKNTIFSGDCVNFQRTASSESTAYSAHIELS